MTIRDRFNAWYALRGFTSPYQVPAYLFLMYVAFPVALICIIKWEMK